MSIELRQRVFDQLDALVLIDPHSHINPHSPAATTLADILGYHYYTELAHSAGMPKAAIEESGLDPKEKVRRLVEQLAPLENTIQYSWLIELCQAFFEFTEDRITPENWESLYDASAAKMASPGWSGEVLERSRLEAVFLTNDFDDPLEGFDSSVYIPCLRTDDLVFKLHLPETRERLARATGIEVSDAVTLRDAIGRLFEHFVSKGAKACAISLPPDFWTRNPRVGDALLTQTIETAFKVGDAGAEHQEHFRSLAIAVFSVVTQNCSDHQLPFDLMIGVNRGVYADGVDQGQDLYNRQTSLYQYADLFNAFPDVTFPISVLDHTANPELVSYGWIFPNVVTNGHWWYSNTPTYIEHDAAARLEAVPATKQIGYYSDMYKLEFALPKFAMYKRVLAKILAERFVLDRGWSEDRAVEFGKQVLRGNVERIFYGEDGRQRAG